MTRAPQSIPAHIRVLAVSAPILAVAGVTNAVLMHRRVERARRDPLTGLLTRTGWSAQAQRLIRHADAVIVLLDLDAFKTVNDTYGHATGDAVLVSTADRLTAWYGPHGVAGRIGGDEFVAVLPDSGHDLGARIAALHNDIARPVSGLGRRLSVHASIGYARAAGLPQADLSRLLRRADAAMYVAKQNGDAAHQATSDVALTTAAVSTNGRRRGRLGTTRGHRIEVAA
jgi:diguanylate cyclase (GGDEF)-like protein